MRAYFHLYALVPLAVGAVSLVLAACDGDVMTASSSATGAGGGGPGSGGSTSVGSTSASGAGGGSTSASGAGGSGVASGAGGGPAVCGGEANLPCSAGEWCDITDPNCGGDDAAGLCKPIPTNCPDDCPGVCGCDGKFYCNECEANAAGWDIDNLSVCAPPPVTYTAEAIFGGLDHLLIYKADTFRNVCVMIHLAHPTQGSPNYSIALPQDYGVIGAYVTSEASDCANAGMMIAGEMVTADGGTGAITFNIPPGKFFPCDVSVHAELSFTSAKAWINPKETLDADAIPVKNGCQ